MKFKTKKYLETETAMAKMELDNCKKILIISVTANICLICLILYLVNLIQ